MLGNKATSARFDSVSVFVGGLALLVDSFVGNIQERMMKLQGVSTDEVVQYMNIFAFCYCSSWLLVSWRWYEYLKFCNSKPSIYIPLILCGIFAFVALSFITVIVKRFGTVVAVMTTSCRKVFTVILSYIVFPKPLVGSHFLGGIIMTAAILLEVFVKTQKSKTSPTATSQQNQSIPDEVTSPKLADSNV